MPGLSALQDPVCFAIAAALDLALIMTLAASFIPRPRLECADPGMVLVELVEAPPAR